MFRDVYVNAGLPATYRLRVEAAALILPADAVVTGRSAAHLWGAELCDPDDPVEVMARRRFGPVRGLRIRTGSLGDDERVVRFGVPVCSALHATWELARDLPLHEAVPWIDALGHGRALSRRAIVAHADRHQNEYGHRRATSALERCDPRAESPPESTLRLHLADAGLPVPVPQYRIFVGGEFLARVDLAWPDIRMAIEYDGQWHSDPNQLGRDRARLRALNEAGWYVYHVTRDDLRDPAVLTRDLARVATARREGRLA